MHYPSYWEKIVKFHANEKLNTFHLGTGSLNYGEIQTAIKSTLPTAKIQSIMMIQNKMQWNSYKTEYENLKAKNGGAKVAEKFLFHGTSGNDPSKVYKSEEGFDLRLSQAGVWGRAIYFAQNASYSTGYAF